MIMFTETEKAYITQSFEMDQVKSHFFKEGISKLEITKEHILMVLWFRDNKIGFIGKSGHESMHAIYHKLGYGKDGKTTLIEIEAEKVRLRQLEETELKKLKDEARSKINNQIKELKEILGDLEKSSADIKGFEDGERAKLEAELQQRLRTKEKHIIQKEITHIKRATEAMNIPQLKKLAKQHRLSGYSKLRKGELIHLINKEIV